jgi:hypothetical protein
VIYGRRRVGASVVEVALTPTLVQADNLHRVCIWGEGPISAVSALYMDAVISTDDRYQQGGNPAFVAEHHLGADDQAASAYMIANIADAAKWNASCTLSGIAYSYVTMVWNPTVFTHGRPVMTADVDGRTLTDPRTGTIAFSRNPALAIRDYLVNARYGRGVDTSMIDDTAFADAAWHCEDQTSVPDGAGGTTLQARYTCDGVLNVDQPVLDNLRALLTSCRGFLVFSGGKYKLKIDRDETVPGASFGYDFTGGAARQFAGGADTPLTVTRAGNTATRVNSTGVIETVAADTARLDYDPLTHACRGLRIEEARTSYCLWNADLTNGVWTPGGATVSANVGTAPDGTATMDALIEDGTTGTHRISQGIATIQRNQFVEASWFVKRHAGTRNLAIQITDGGANYDYIQFDLDAKTASSSGAAGNGVHVSAGVDDYGGGVYRCWLVGKVDATVGTAGFSFYAYLVNVASNSYTGDGASGLRLWGGMVAATTASIPTSVILTTSAAVTRNVDVPTIAPGSWYRAAAFSMLVEFIEPYNTGTPARLVGLRGSNDADTPLYVNGTKIGMFDGANGGAEPALDTANSFTLGATSRGAMGYTQGVGVSISLNGGTCATRTNANWDWGTTTAIHLGQQPGGTNVLNGWLRTFAYIPRRLSDAELQSLSSARYPFVLSADNIVGGWSIALGGKRNRFNRVRARFFNRDAAWQPDYAVFEDLAHRAADAGQVLEQTLDLPYTASAYTAAQIAQIEERRSRYGTLVSLTATIAATCLEVGDVVPVAHATPGWPAAGDPAEGKLFRVIEMELLSSDEVRLTLLEYQASVYQLSTPSQVRTVAQTSLPDMSIAATPGAPAVAEVLYQTTSSAGFKSRATLSWGAANDAFVQSGGWYQLERSPQGAGSWTIYPQIPSPGRGVATVSFTVDDVSPGTYDWRVAAFNSIGAKSAYSPTTTKEIAGLNAPPSNVANFAVQSYSGQAKFTWDKPSTATDLAVVQSGRIYVRWSPKTSGAAWDNGSLVNPDGYPGDTSIGFGPLMGGTYMAKLWNGRAFSVTEATFVVTEALITGLVTLATVDEAPAFAGAKSNVAAVDSGIQLDGTTLIDAMLTNIDTWSALDSLGGVRGSGSYSFANTLDLGSKQAARLVSNIDSLGFSTDDMVDSRTDPIDNWGMVDGDPIEDAEVSLWTRHTDDDPAGAPAWSAWERLGHVADFNFRAFQFRLDFATGSPTHNRRVSALSVTAKH